MDSLDKKANEIWKRKRDHDYTTKANPIKTSFQLENPAILVTVNATDDSKYTYVLR